MEKIDMGSIPYEILKQQLCKTFGQPEFRVKQIYSWIHQKHVKSFDEMTNIPKNLRYTLTENYFLNPVKIINCFHSKNSETIKYLLKIDDSNIIECVVMKYSFGNTICISTQVGCKMGCTFCASSKFGFVKNLSTYQILSQIYTICLEFSKTNQRISNIVLMGAGEPLDNFENVLTFLNIICDEKGLNISQRKITISTCGLIDKIYYLANLKLKINLAISLHAPTDEIRRSFMPISNSYNILDLIKACTYYANTTKRRITYEYALIDNINDTIICANMLSKLIKSTLCHVNLIPINKINESNFTHSNSKKIQQFANILEENNVTTTIRRTLGNDIYASCGQLKNSFIQDSI